MKSKVCYDTFLVIISVLSSAQALKILFGSGIRNCIIFRTANLLERKPANNA